MGWIRINHNKIFLALLSIIAGLLLGYFVVFLWAKYFKREIPRYLELAPTIKSECTEPLYDHDHLIRLGYDFTKDTNDLIVNDAKTAVDIAEAILFSITDSSSVVKYKPYSVRLVNNELWEVEGYDKSSKVFHVLISGKTGAVIELLPIQ